MDVTYAGIVVVPLLIALVAMLRGLGLAARYAPPAAVALGVLVAVLYTVAEGGASLKAVLDAVLVGLALGLSAVGLHSGVKNTTTTTTSTPPSSSPLRLPPED